MIEILLALIVAVTGIGRTVDPGLTAIAEQRAVEVSTDATWNHDLMRGGWEVLAWNSGFPDPATKAVEQWALSPAHWTILTDPSLTRIGCGYAVGQEGRDVFACVLNVSPVVATPTNVYVPSEQTTPPEEGAPFQRRESQTTRLSSAPSVLLPDTAMTP